MRPERALTCIALTGVIAWVAVSLWSAPHGFDLTDESFYLASYRWWSSSTLTFTGAQYVVGPLFQALGYDVALLRVTRVAALLVLHADLAVCLLAWLSHLLGHAVPRATRAWVISVIVAVGASPSIWLPRSPGYNDLTIMGALVLGSTVLTLAARTPDRGLPAPRLLTTGAVLVALLLSKWSTAVMILCFLVGVGVWALRVRGVKGLVGVTALIATGSAAAALLVQLATPWPTILDGLAEVNRSVAATTNSPVSLLALYVRSTSRLVVAATSSALLVSVPLLLPNRLPRTRAWYSSLIMPVLAVGLPFVVLRQAPVGGPDHFFAFSVAWTAWAGIFLAGARRGWRVRDARTRAVFPVLGWLAALPWLFGLGTGNQIYFLAFSLVAPWLAVLISLIVITDPAMSEPGEEPRRHELTGGRATSLAAAVAVVLSCAITGTATVPYRTYGTTETTAPLPGGGPLAGLRVTPTEATEYAALINTVGPAQGRRLLALDELPGLALVLDLQPLGEVWASRIDRARTANGVRSSCDEPLSLLPIVVADRGLGATDRAALAACGANVGDYERVRLRLGARDLTVLLPPDLARR